MVYFLFRLAGLLCPLLPARFGYWLFARIGDLAFIFAANRQQTYLSNLRRVLGNEVPPGRLYAVARRGFQNLFKNYYDLFRGGALTNEQLLAQLTSVEGLQYLRDAIQQGKGVIAGSAHFGTFDIIIHLAPALLGVEIVAPVERLRPVRVFNYLLSLRRSHGVNLVPVDEAPRRLLRALEAGQVIGLAYDRDITQTGPLVEFFGEPARLPQGAVQLALKYDLPVIVAFSIRQEDNRSRGYVEPPLYFENTGNKEKDICIGVQKIATIMERYIRQYPDQWLMFQKIWE
jgi:KDO2-lipid IV(A) lauroyltransferase